MHHESEKRRIGPRNAFKIILEYIAFCMLQKRYSECGCRRGVATLSFSSLAFPLMKNLILFHPSHPVLAECLRRPRQPAQQQRNRLAAQELYIAPPPWRCAHTGTHTDAHAGFGMRGKKGQPEMATSLTSCFFPTIPFFFFFSRNFPSRVSDFPAILLPIATSNLIPAGPGTGPTPSAQMRSPREDAMEPILTQSVD